MAVEVLGGSESVAVAQPRQTAAEMSRFPTRIDGPPAAVSSRRVQTTWFQALFLGIADDTSPLTLGTVDLRASEASMAMREAILMPWPPQAIGFRLLDLRRIGGGAKGNG
jgi:hypothetical protein